MLEYFLQVAVRVGRDSDSHNTCSFSSLSKSGGLIMFTCPLCANNELTINFFNRDFIDDLGGGLLNYL